MTVDIASVDAHAPSQLEAAVAQWEFRGLRSIVFIGRCGDAAARRYPKLGSTLGVRSHVFVCRSSSVRNGLARNTAKTPAFSRRPYVAKVRSGRRELASNCVAIDTNSQAIAEQRCCLAAMTIPNAARRILRRLRRDELAYIND